MITETYRDIEITLLEDENKWRFTANGRQRTAPTLPKAREYIDNTLDAVETKKEKPWEPFSVWTNEGYSHGWRKIRVTSIAEHGHTGKAELWTVDDNATDYRGNKKPERKKISETWLRTDTPENAQAVSTIQALNAQIETLSEQVRDAERKMTPFTLPSEVA